MPLMSLTVVKFLCTCLVYSTLNITFANCGFAVVCLVHLCRAVQDKWTSEGGSGPGPLCQEAAERKTQSSAGQQHPAERSGQWQTGGVGLKAEPTHCVSQWQYNTAGLMHQCFLSFL